MAKFQINFVKYVKRPKRPKIIVSPQEKFNRLAKRLKNKNNKSQLRKHHYNAIEAGKKIIVFDGDGIEVFQAENLQKGYVQARLHCLSLFFASENQAGGYTFTFNFNCELLTAEELEEAKESTRRSLSYVLPKEEVETSMKCNYCFFEFQSKNEYDIHQCSHGSKGWIVFEFTKVRKVA